MTPRLKRTRSVLGVLCTLVAIAGCGDKERRAASTATTGATPAATVAPAQPAAPPVEAPTTAPAPEPAAAPRKPAITRMLIPYGARRKQQMAAYSQRHYGDGSYELADPRVIVEHFTVTDSVQATYDIFAPNQPDPELNELPGVCSHFVIGTTGRIYQLVPLTIRCRHTVGLNDRSFGIEHVGRSDGQILANRRQLAASLRLTAWLRCRYDIRVRDVIGHNESLSSPYHHENVERLRTQTHDDFTKASMSVYRHKLRKRRC